MINIQDDIIYNTSYIFCIAKSKISFLEPIEHSFGNICLFEDTMGFIQQFRNFCAKNKIKKVILVDYEVSYATLARYLQGIDIEVSCFCLSSLGALSDAYSRDVLNGILGLYEDNLISSIAFLDYNLFCVFEKHFTSFYLPLDFPHVKLDSSSAIHKSGIGIISDSANHTHSFYNALSAIKLNQMQANLASSDAVKSFVKTFSIQANYLGSKQVLENSQLNLFINFSENNYGGFFKSMDLGTICLLGNQQIIDADDPLYKHIVVKSDDDIIEIAHKITSALANQEEILELYQDFRQRYVQKVDEMRKKFLPNFHHTSSARSEKLLSVIVPIYNTEKYLETSINSIIKATIPNMEIILINDGSKDSSGQIARRFARKYPNLIQYVEQKNHGLGHVRNVGLDYAKGQYITSVDSDDTIAPEFYKKAQPYLLSGVDVVLCDWQTVNQTSSFETSAKDGVYDKFDGFESFLYASIMPSACNKIFKKTIFTDIQLRFAEKKYEDLSANPIALLRSETIAYLPSPYYIYNVNDESIMRSKIGLDMVDVLEILNDRLKTFCQNYGDFDALYYYVFFWRIEEFIINPLYEVSPKELGGRIKYIYAHFLSILKTVYTTPLVKGFFSSLQDSQKKEFFTKRNKALLNGKLQEFVLSCKKDNLFKITPPDVYFGNQA